MVRQSIFAECELILINANSPRNEEPIIKEYLTQYPNMKYISLAQDPGVYGVWNMGIKLASADLITNANLDDRRNPQSLEIQAQALEQDASIDLVYGDYLKTYIPNETFENNHYKWTVKTPDFSLRTMNLCLPGPQPMWRKTMHDKYGFFKDDMFHSADWEMWLRAASKGSQFKKIPDLITGLYYENPKGLSTDQDEKRKKRRDGEDEYIIKNYAHVWQNARSV